MPCKNPAGCACVQENRHALLNVCGWNRHDYEADPAGLTPKDAGAKLDAGKPMILRGVLQYFPRAIRAVAEVSEYGSIKYTWGGWKSVPDGIVRYGEAGMRHKVSDAAGETHDADTGKRHKAHAAWNALAELELALIEAEATAANAPASEGTPIASPAAEPAPLRTPEYARRAR